MPWSPARTRKRQSPYWELKPRHLGDITTEVSVLEAPEVLRTIVGGGVNGRTRVVVKDGF